MVVSIRIEANHFAPAPIGSEILIGAEITKIEDREVLFKVEAFDQDEKIASGQNDMFIIDKARFEKGIKRKLENQ